MPRLLRFALVALAIACLPAAGCDLADSLGVPDSDNFDFSTACSNIASAGCTDCCKGIGFQTSLFATGDCGCAYSVKDAVVCEDSNSSFQTCISCCETAGYSSAGSGSAGCRCLRTQKTPPTGDQTATGSSS